MNTGNNPSEKKTTAQGTPYTVAKRDAYGAVTVTVGDHKAAKRVKQDASGNRYRSLAGETFDTLDAVADSMRWAL